MASFTATTNSSFLRLQTSSSSPLILSYHQQFNGGVSCRRNRGSLVVTRAGAPGTTTYIFAFLFPLSLLAVTIFTSIKISDKLDKDFYEEVITKTPNFIKFSLIFVNIILGCVLMLVGKIKQLEVNQSILEAEDEDEDGGDVEENFSQQRTRNRPKRDLMA